MVYVCRISQDVLQTKLIVHFLTQKREFNMLVNGVQIELISFQRTLPNESKPIQARKTHELFTKTSGNIQTAFNHLE